MAYYLAPPSWKTCDNSLQPCELHMISLFESRGRNNLANCIRHGRVYLRLSQALLLDNSCSLFYLRMTGYINGLKAAFRELDQKGVGGHVGRIEEWEREGFQRYKDDQVLLNMRQKVGEWDVMKERGVGMSESELEEVYV
ncbi:hypothetical protein L198_02398 [Cryptococcus wingfieldii CBS 7118]|uniref:Uncharacterized protein n=1 Tax=Cryptococcus wingfieldii CBS 7118 TaxID=1295528 RepID=A0A1E3JRQ7_9TREE|nr:hypothetical protein L198_02398 [Cryptococcus wingfieldii CBS 7118]ODO03550.1 hypothetical protein L198_02398 [Cryptococcus wingfieldii CBS 7118]